MSSKVSYPKLIVEYLANTFGRNLLVQSGGISVPPPEVPKDEIPWTDLEPSIPIVKPPVSCEGAYNYVTFNLHENTTNHIHANYAVELNGAVYNAAHTESILGVSFELAGYEFSTYYGSDGSGTMYIGDVETPVPVRIKLIPSATLSDNNIYGVSGGGEVRYVNNNTAIEFCLKPDIKVIEEIPLPVLTCEAPSDSIGFSVSGLSPVKYHVTINGADYGDIEFIENGIQSLGPLTVDVDMLFGSDNSGWFTMGLVSAGTESLPVRVTLTPATDSDNINVGYVSDAYPSAIHDTNLNYLGFCLIERAVECIPTSVEILPYYTGSDGPYYYHAKYRINDGEWVQWQAQSSDPVNEFFETLTLEGAPLITGERDRCFIYDDYNYRLSGLPNSGEYDALTTTIEFDTSVSTIVIPDDYYNRGSLDLVEYWGGARTVMSCGRIPTHIVDYPENTEYNGIPLTFSVTDTNLDPSTNVPLQIELYNPTGDWKLKAGDALLADNWGSRVYGILVKTKTYAEEEPPAGGLTGAVTVTTIIIDKMYAKRNTYSLFGAAQIGGINTSGAGSWIHDGDGSEFIPSFSVEVLSFSDKLQGHRFSVGSSVLTVPSSLPNYVTNLDYMFAYSPYFNQDISMWNTSNVTTMSNTFDQCESFNRPIGNWNTSNVTNMYGMFQMAYAFNQDLSQWNVSQVTTMERMFGNAAMFDQNISNWDVSRVTNMSYMFNGGIFNHPIGNWNVSQVTTMVGMFYQAGSFDQDISNWNISNVTTMWRMFEEAYSFNQDISGWNTSNVTEMDYLFYLAYAFNQDLSNWCVSKLSDPGWSFFYQTLSWVLPKPVWGTCPRGEDGTVTEPTVPSLPDMTLPSDSINFTTTNHIGTTEAPVIIRIQDAVGQWGLKRNGVLIANSSFNSVPGVVVGTADGIPIIRLAWDTSNPTTNTNQYELYVKADTVAIREGESSNSNAELTIELTKFSSLVKLHQFPVYYGSLMVPTTLPSYITTTRGMFKNNEYFDVDISGWNMTNVTDTSEMFYAASSFNQPIGVWNVSNVTTMADMFGSNFGFDIDISSWDTSKVTNMDGMFYGAYLFNKDLSTWKVPLITAEPYHFYNTLSNNWTLPKPVWGGPKVTIPENTYLFSTDNHMSDKNTYRIKITLSDVSEEWTLYDVDNLSVFANQNTVTEDNRIYVSTSGSGTAKQVELDIMRPTMLKHMYALAGTFSNVKITDQYTANDNSAIVPNMNVNVERFSPTIDTYQLSLLHANLTVPTTLPPTLTDLSNLFQYSAYFNQDLSTWDTSNVTSMYGTFSNAIRFNGNVSTWNTAKVIDMDFMFNEAQAFNQDLSNWSVPLIPSRPTGFSSTFHTLPKPAWGGIIINALPFIFKLEQGAGSKELPVDIILTGSIGEWSLSAELSKSSVDLANSTVGSQDSGVEVNTVGNVTTIKLRSTDRYKGTYSLTGRFDTVKLFLAPNSNLTGTCMVDQFSNVITHHEFSLDVLRLSVNALPDYVKSAKNMFKGSLNTNLANVAAWNTVNITTMEGMFEGCIDFNVNINGLNTRNVTNMDRMFSGASIFNQDLSGWNTTSIRSVPVDFNKNATQWTLPKPVWNV